MADEERVAIQVNPPSLGDFIRPLYANNVNVNHTPHDFRIVFSTMAIPVAPPKDGKMELTPEAVADIRIPASLMYALIGVLNDQFAKYLDAYGPPNMNPEGPGR